MRWGLGQRSNALIRVTTAWGDGWSSELATHPKNGTFSSATD